MPDMTLTLKDSYGRVIAKTESSGGKKVDIIGTKTKTQIGGKDSSRVVAKTIDEATGEEEVATGYVEDEELEQWYEETVSIPSNFAGLEAAMVPTRLRDQLFEISDVVEGDDYVEITALHIFYRQRQNSTTWEPGKTTKYSGAAACRNVMQNVLFDTGFSVASDSTDLILGDELDYARKNIVECFLNPESGICAKYGLSLIRDNDVFYCLKNVGFDRGFVVQSGKNLLGVQRTESIENIITRVAPLGRDADGNLVWMNYNGSNYVDSSHICEYASPRLEILQTDIQVGRDGVTAENIHEKLREKALARFSEDEVDIPEVTMTIEFISLGDTEEYQQYRDLDRVYLYDILHINDETRGYSYGAQVIGVRHNILTGRLERCTIGTPQPWDGVRKVAVWRMPEIDGSLIRQNTIRAGKFMEGAIRSDDIADAAVKADHISSTGTGNAADAIKRLSLEQLIVENTSEDGLLHTRFAVTEGLIQAEVTRATSAETSMGTRLTQNETAITAEATRATSAESSISGQLTVEAGKVAMVVGTNSSGNFIKAAEIATSINEAGEGVATIDADKVYIGNEKSTTVISGKLNVSDLTGHLVATKLADVAIVYAQTLDATTVDVGTVNADTVYEGDIRLGTCFKDVSVSTSGNNVTLTFERATGQSKEITFSKAIASASWAWSNGAPVVTLSPQGQSFTGDAVDGVYKRGDPSWASDYKSVRQNVRIDSEGGTTIKNDYIDIDTTAAYNSGSSAGYSSGRASVTVGVSISYSSAFHVYVANALGSNGATDSETSGREAYDDGYKAGYNAALSDAGVPNGGTVYTGTWRGRLWDAPHQSANPVDNCLAGASYHTLTKK